MLTHLHIRDFVIVEQLELELGPGMSTLTGETGAGKSIVVDALGLLLGDRADSSVVRTGAERAEISGTFDLSGQPAARAWLAERSLDGGGEECQLRRVIASSGRSRAYIDGSPQPLQALRELGEQLVDIHGQHEHQSLLKRDLQRQLLDDYAGYPELLAEVATGYRRWREQQRQLAGLQQASQERQAKLDLLRYQVRELLALALQEGELADLEVEHRRLANAGRLLETCQSVLGWLYEGGDGRSVHDLLTRALQELTALAGLDARLTPLGELLNNALIQVAEASSELRHYTDRLELDPARLAWVEQRLADIHELARKHRLPPAELPAKLVSWQRELVELEEGALQPEQLAQQVAASQQAYLAAAEQLSQRRAVVAADLAERVSAAMQSLGMPGGRFQIELEKLEKPAAQGLEAVEFLVSANPGQPLRPLSKVASGGELSRISLAIQVIAAHSAQLPTLIFDEVDTGIGGGTAEVVGRQLRTLGKSRQVLCVTHLPQVAAQAHRHYRVSKHSDGQTTRAQIEPLDEEQRVLEVARMLGGLELTANTKAHAREMIAGAGED